MTKDKEETENCCIKTKWQGNGHGAMGGCFYFLTFIGVAVYYVQQSTTFWMGVLGVLKAIVWPAILIYKIFTMLHM
ncbi:MAG: hypothetical protein M1338_02590 [Patescibacteria group bacterium]|nr:hypothetical protein [Patescibacteria group bacterium]